MKSRNISYKKIALAFSAVLLMIWGLLGAGTSLAWFTDTTPEIRNIFHVAEFDLEVFYKDENGNWQDVEGATKMFNDQALYEPGYVQVVYLKIRNNGTVPFDYKSAVSVSNYIPGTNVFGQRFELQDYLRFGVVTASTENELLEKLDGRDLAKEASVLAMNEYELHNYETTTHALEAGGEDYAALIVRMPESVGNEANYRGNTVPQVSLGLIVNASQQSE